MRRSKYGYLLLALLVITGLAGTITSTTITNKERKFAATHFKDAKNDLIKSIQGLSKKQLSFRPAPGIWSVREAVYEITNSEEKSWSLLRETLKHPANPERRSSLKWTDMDLINAIERGVLTQDPPLTFASKKEASIVLDDAAERFSSKSVVHLQYIKNTTEDLRNHVVQTTFGWVDCYQLCLIIGAQNRYGLRKIEELKSDPGFPTR